MFEPLNRANSVQEAVFIFGLSKVLDRRLIEDIYQDHANKRFAWAEDLPKAQRHQVIQFAMGQPDVQIPEPVAPVSFETYQKTGELEKRLLLNENAIIINVLIYENWNDTFKWCQSVFDTIVPFLIKYKYQIANCGLQYINSFRWNGNTKAYNIDLLLKKPNKMIPESVWDYGGNPVWHAHRGVMYEVQTAISGTMLERIHVDSGIEAGAPITRIDSLFHLTPYQSFSPSPPLAGLQGGRMWVLFDQLHGLSKSAVAAYLNDTMRDRIGIGAP